MSNVYRLRPREGTQTYQKITTGRKWVGRVTQHADGTWIGVIGKLMVKGMATSHQAFDEVVARHLGYPSAAALRSKNAQVRRVKRAVNQAADAAYREVMSGNFKPMDTPAGALLTLRGLTRDLRRK